MLLRVSDWEFEIDMSATMEYSAIEAAEHCLCGYCRNFYEAVDAAYPELRPFLAQFGIDIEAPDELMPFQPTHILNLYAVSGRILKKGSNMKVNEISVFAETAEEAMMNTACPRPYFVLNVGPMDLPWVLEESVEEVESEANLPNFFTRMAEKFIRLFRKNDTIS